MSNTSEYGTGAVFLHKFEDGCIKPVARASRTLLAKKNYSQIEKEILAMIFAFKKFHKFVCGRNLCCRQITIFYCQ